MLLGAQAVQCRARAVLPGAPAVLRSATAMRALVTGATGFIGSHLAERLVAEGWSVRALVRDEQRARRVLGPTVEICVGDVRDATSIASATDGVERVFHLAARVSDWGPWRDFEATTVDGTRNAVEAAIGARVPRFVLVSTTGVYDAAAVGTGHVTEDAPLTADASAGNRYGYAKALADRIAFDAHEAGKIEVVLLRPAWVYGPRDRTLLPRMLDFLKDRSSAFVSGSDPDVGLVYVTDLVDAIVRAATSQRAAGKAFNVSAVESIKLRVLAARIAEGARVRVPTREVPLLVARMAAAVIEDFARLTGRADPPSLTRMALAMMLEGNPYDVTRARSVLGWEPRVPHADGIERTMQWARDEGLS
jgi:2-alkyl-3-oxoalkanoate reductase